MHYLKSLAITLLVAIIYFYFFLPPINPTCFSFWIFIVILMVVFAISAFSLNTITIITNANTLDLRLFKIGRGPMSFLIAILIIFGGIIVTNIVLSPLFIPDAYANRIDINEDNVFHEDVEPVDFNTLPVIDKASSIRLGDRVMGELPDLVSQFDVSKLYTQINHQGEIMRVTPLEYSDFFKYFNNRHEGTAGYIKVNSVTGEAQLVRLDDGMKYVNSAILNQKLDRKLRFTYPTKIFGGKYFELDPDGNPIWVVPTIQYAGVNIRPSVEGVIILDPVTGDSDYYPVDEAPKWIDHVYPSKLITEKTNDWGRYKEGFWNSLFGQRNVVQTTRGYNYTIIDDDVYLYTGITSVIGDESNLGFILTNLRTRETNFYTAPGAEEYSARASAQGQVQHMNYNATFPLLVNVKNRPTYFLSLKDQAGLVKMYALVDVRDYQKVVVTDITESVEQAIINYIGDQLDDDSLIEETITIAEITTAAIDGTSYYFITDDNNDRFITSIKTNQKLLPFLQPGDQIIIRYYDRDEEVTEILVLTK